MTPLTRTLADAARAVGGRLVGEDRAFGSVSSDSRTVPSGALFVALRGPRFDGAEFVAAAAARGAAGALVDRPVAAALPLIVVADVLAALQTLAARWRTQFTRPLVAVAGSNGKTTTKEMTAAILARLGVAPQQSVIVGDRLLTDVAMADELGMSSVLVLSGVTSLEDLAQSDVRPDFVVRTLRDVLPNRLDRS